MSSDPKPGSAATAGTPCLRHTVPVFHTTPGDCDWPFRTVWVQPDNDGNPRNKVPWTPPICPHPNCWRPMPMVQQPFNTEEPPSWMCPVHGNEGVVFLYEADPPVPPGASGVPFHRVYAAMGVGNAD